MTTATLGVDLASQPKNTGVCAIEWERNNARVVALIKGADDRGSPLNDRLLVAAFQGRWPDLPTPSKIAIDAPLGWPLDFAHAVGRSGPWPVGIDGDRKRLERRATDYWVHNIASKMPLSVTTDRIAFAAMRAAGILSHFEAASGAHVDRSGMVGLVCETYPDPAIRRLGLWPPAIGGRDSYKRDAVGVRESIVRRLREAAPWLGIASAHEQACVDSDDCLDALVCALMARANEQNLTVAPPARLQTEARSEGWIHLPRDAFRIDDLLG